MTAIWREHFAGLWVSSLGGVFAAMLMMVLSRSSTFEVLILIAPLPVILYVTLRHALGRAEDQISHLGKMNRVYVATIEALAQAVDAKDQVTHDHIRRVQQNALRLAARLGVRDDAELQAIKAASLLHDIGKIAIPEHILNKPGRLTPSEFEVMKRHATIGADILDVIGFPYPLVPIVRHHHENWDGTGYPHGLAGEQIPIGARILQVVDCFDALTSDRPYRPRLDDAEALKIVTDRRGKMYDPRVVDALVELHAAGVCRTPALEPPAAMLVPDAPVAVERPDDGGERQRLEAFCGLGRALATPATAAHVGEAVWVHLCGQMPASAFALFTYDPHIDALAPAYLAGAPGLSVHTRIPVGERLSGWVAANRRAIANSDARLDFDPDVREDTPLRSALSLPMMDDGAIVGVLAFYAERPNAFDETHQRIAEAAALVVARALHAPAPKLAAVVA
jgi:putative nucleotidyltransferase with HDIG domain